MPEGQWDKSLVPLGGRHRTVLLPVQTAQKYYPGDRGLRNLSPGSPYLKAGAVKSFKCLRFISVQAG